MGTKKPDNSVVAVATSSVSGCGGVITNCIEIVTVPKTEDAVTIIVADKRSNAVATENSKTVQIESKHQSVTTTEKKIRRAFSMPRNPFRWSRKFKTNSTCIGSTPDESTLERRSGSIISVNSYTTISAVNHTKDDVCNEAAGTTIAKSTNKNKSENDFTGTSSTTPGLKTFVSTTNNRVFRRSSFRKFLNRIAQHVSSSVNIGANKRASSQSLAPSDRVPPIGGYQWPADQTPGVTGLKNHGNTCFMNAVLQCLSHTDILAEYFVLDQYKADLKRRNKINSRKFGTKGELTEQLANVLKALWTCKNESDHSTSFKAVVDRYGSQFRSSTQHDAQEFLFWLLDKVHEDLNTATKRRYKSVKNNYGRPDEVIAAETLANHIRCNNSFVQAVFQAQFRSSLTCPRCKKQSNTFDPFHCVSVQLPQLTQQAIFVTVLYLRQDPRQVKLGLTVPAGSPIIALRQQLQKDTGIPSNRMVLVDINETGFSRVFYDTQPVSTLDGIDTIYCIEVPEVSGGRASEVSITTGDVKGSSSQTSTDLTLLIANVHKNKNAGGAVERFGTPFCLQVPRDCSYAELQKRLLREMTVILKPEGFAYTMALSDMFQIRLQDPSADPDTYLEQVEHPLFTEIIDMALSVLSSDAGPPHIKLLLEWSDPAEFFTEISDSVFEDESVSRLLDIKTKDTALTLEQCLEHYTKAETLSAEDAWRCPHCQQYLPVVKTLGLWSLPDILVVHFKRFRQHHDKGADAAKLTTMVKFPLNAFDMAPHLAKGTATPGAAGTSVEFSSNSNDHHTNLRSPWRKTREPFRACAVNSGANSKDVKDKNDTRYDLYAVCYHQGDTLETGHYTAACKNPYDHQWYKFDDQRVSKVPSDSIQEEIINNEAYMLFYQRRKTDTIECSGSSSTSNDHWVSKIAVPLLSGERTTSSTTTNVSIMNASKIGAIEKVDKLSEKVEKISLPAVIVDTQEDEVKSVSGLLDNKAVVAVTAASPLSAPSLPADTPKTVVIRKTDESQLVDVEGLEFEESLSVPVAKEEGDKTHFENAAAGTSSIQLEMDEDFKTVISNDEFDVSSSVMGNISKTEVVFDIEPQMMVIKQPTPAHAKTQQPKSPSQPRNITSSAAVSKSLSPNVHAKEAHTSKTKIIESSSSSSSSRTSVSSRSPPLPLKSEAAANSVVSESSSSSSRITSPIPPTQSNNTNSQHCHNDFSTKYNGIINNSLKEIFSSSLKSNSSSIMEGESAGFYNGFPSASSSLCLNGSTSSGGANATATTTAADHHCVNLRHSFSTSSNYKLKDCNDTLSSMLRNNANTCSKDTLIFIDQQNHSLMDDDNSFLGSRSLWISPVTPHKLITVSPKN